MTETQIGDIIVPTVFNPYVTEKSVEMDALVASGIIDNDPDFDVLARAGGKLINMPFWKQLTGVDENLDSGGSLTPGKITTGQDIAVLLARGRAWGADDLSGALAGADPMAAIGNLVAKYWVGRRQATLLSLLKGIFATTMATSHTLDVSGNTDPASPNFTANNFLDAAGLLGDASDGVTAMAIHSATYTSMKKQDLIDFQLDSQGMATIPFYMGKRVIVDDLMPVDTGVYTTYLFGPGAIALGNGGAPVPTETDRDSLGGIDYLINRQHFILHPRGVKFTSSSVAGTFPTNAELETGANWSKVYDDKNIKIVRFIHTLAS